MRFLWADVQNCHRSTGVVVVIDVVRAFTTAAYALAAGAGRILPVETVEDALRLREQIPGSLTMGESGGMPVTGFDFWNSPSEVAARGAELSGRTVIQRTSAGTQGIVRAASAEVLFAASLVVAAATARAIQELSPEVVTWVPTGWRAGETGSGSEDVACAEYISAILQGLQPRPEDYLRWKAARQKSPFPDAPPDLLRRFHADLECCARVDAFDFAMPVTRRDGLWELRPQWADRADGRPPKNVI